MEYRRRSNKGRTASRSAARRRQAASPAASGAGRAFVVLLLVAAAVYVISASASGAWIAENIMAPAIEAVMSIGSPADVKAPDDSADPAVAQTSASPGTAYSPDASNEMLLSDGGSTAAAAVSEDLSLPALDAYMLQMGVYKDEANANAQAQSLKELGAAGYVLLDEGRYRVMASCYSAQADAKEVKDRLVGEGVDCTVHAVSTSPVAFRVTAPEEKLAQVKRGFDALYAVQTALYDAVIAFDRDSKSVDAGKADVSAIKRELDESVDAFRQYAASQPVLLDILSCCEGVSESLEMLINGDFASRVDFSSNMKYNQIDVTNEYVLLTKKLSS